MPNPLKFQIYPEVNGIVTMNGEPVEGAEVTMSYIFRGKQGSTICKTDRNGVFTFKEKTIYSLASILLLQSVISQKLSIKYNHIEYSAWNVIKYNPSDDPKLTKLLTNLTCELTNPETKQKIDPESVNPMIVRGIARWSL